ncbi:MAG: TIGR03757 family integrating conjugative element protein [Chromatiaceae bacterium]|nr:TIGR03757 family integrating conjugative element protein [Chromatiaceae bacterium]MCP5439729.1 TIGR03757 family integrating conjugative element protein [Chromatiaceae bacterium]
MYSALLLVLLLVANAAFAEPRVEVFTDRGHPVAHTKAFADMTVYRLDGLALAQDQLSEGLPSDPAEAATVAAQRLDAQPSLNEQMMQAGQGLTLAHLQYRLDRYPAIVFDGVTVIYGVTDLAIAYRLYEAHK